MYYDYKLMAGNVVTPEITEELVTRHGVAIVKVGIGPGSACSTRRETGVGYPQLSAVLECAEAAKRNHASICADGGIQNPGDVVKAFAAGASYVMLGGALAGHDEGYHPKDLGKIFNEDRKVWEAYHAVTELPFHGMASKAAQELHNGGLANYRASEGKIFKIPRKGSVSKTLEHYLGGIRSACMYLGCKSISELSEDAVFVKVNRVMNQVYDHYET
jgi:GMP reductase